MPRLHFIAGHESAMNRRAQQNQQMLQLVGLRSAQEERDRQFAADEDERARALAAAEAERLYYAGQLGVQPDPNLPPSVLAREHGFGQQRQLRQEDLNAQAYQAMLSQFGQTARTGIREGRQFLQERQKQRAIVDAERRFLSSVSPEQRKQAQSMILAQRAGLPAHGFNNLWPTGETADPSEKAASFEAIIGEYGGPQAFLPGGLARLKNRFVRGKDTNDDWKSALIDQSQADRGRIALARERYDHAKWTLATAQRAQRDYLSSSFTGQNKEREAVVNRAVEEAKDRADDAYAELEAAMMASLRTPVGSSPHLGQMQAAPIHPQTSPEHRGSIPAHVDASKAEIVPSRSRTPADGGIVDVSTPDEAMALPSGTRFRTPDGQIRVRR